jgi:hypothetical protein
MRTRIEDPRTITPGTLIDGREVGIPRYWSVDHVREIEAFKRHARHLAIDIGAKRTRKAVSGLHLRIKRLARLAAREGLYLTINTRQYDITWNKISVEVWFCRSQRIEYRAMVEGWGSGRALTGDYKAVNSSWGTTDWTRADVAWRRIKAATAKAKAVKDAKREQEAAKYVESLPEDIRTLQSTARPHCIRVSPDGRSVTECLHDVGGSMSWTEGSNGFTMPASLAEMQAQHDAVYHRDGV